MVNAPVRAPTTVFSAADAALSSSTTTGARRIPAERSVAGPRSPRWIELPRASAQFAVVA
jgi:hypothetical protein